MHRRTLYLYQRAQVPQTQSELSVSDLQAVLLYAATPLGDIVLFRNGDYIAITDAATCRPPMSARTRPCSRSTPWATSPSYACSAYPNDASPTG